MYKVLSKKQAFSEVSSASHYHYRLVRLENTISSDFYTSIRNKNAIKLFVWIFLAFVFNDIELKQVSTMAFLHVYHNDFQYYIY